MERKDIIMFCVGLVAAAALIWACLFLMPDNEVSHASTITTETPLIDNPNQINGLDISADDYRVYIKYTPEPGAKTLRVEYTRQSGGSSDSSSEFDFPINDENPVQATFQRSSTVYWGMRVTIIYDNNVIKFIEFST
jgi:hypothetical protein